MNTLYGLFSGSVRLMKSSDPPTEHALHLAAMKCNNGPLAPRRSAEAWRRAVVSVCELADQWFDKHGLHLFLALITINM